MFVCLWLESGLPDRFPTLVLLKPRNKIQIFLAPSFWITNATSIAFVQLFTEVAKCSGFGLDHWVYCVMFLPPVVFQILRLMLKQITNNRCNNSSIWQWKKTGLGPLIPIVIAWRKYGWFSLYLQNALFLGCKLMYFKTSMHFHRFVFSSTFCLTLAGGGEYFPLSFL